MNDISEILRALLDQLSNTEEVERELWKPVTDYRGWPIREGYWVSNKGRVYSQIGDKKQLLKMNHYKSSKRYYVRMTGKDGKRRNVNPAWLVISAWVRNPLPNCWCKSITGTGTLPITRLQIWSTSQTASTSNTIGTKSGHTSKRQSRR